MTWLIILRIKNLISTQQLKHYELIFPYTLFTMVYKYIFFKTKIKLWIKKFFIRLAFCRNLVFNISIKS